MSNFSSFHTDRRIREIEERYRQYASEQIFHTTTTANILKGSQIGETMTNKLRDYEVALADGTTLHLERVDSVTTDTTFTAFWRTDADGTRERIQTYRNEAIWSFRQVPPSEEVIRPKYTFQVIVSGDEPITVQADLHKVSTYGDTQFVEFYTRVPSGGSREELSVPASRVLSVLRVDDPAADVKAVAVDTSKLSGQKI